MSQEFWMPEGMALVAEFWPNPEVPVSEIARLTGRTERSVKYCAIERLKLPPRVDPKVQKSRETLIEFKETAARMLKEGKTFQEIRLATGRDINLYRSLDAVVRDGSVTAKQREAGRTPRYSQIKPLMAVGPASKCQWMTGDRYPNIRECGEPSVPGCSYCPAHKKIVFVKPPPHRTTAQQDYAPKFRHWR